MGVSNLRFHNSLKGGLIVIFCLSLFLIYNHFSDQEVSSIPLFKLSHSIENGGVKNIIVNTSRSRVKHLNKVLDFTGNVTILKQVDACSRPYLDPFDPEVMRHMKKPKVFTCHYQAHWLYIVNGTFYKSTGKKMKDVGNFSCNVTEVLRKDEGGMKYGKTISNIKNGTKMSTDYMTANCINQKGQRHTMTYFGTVPLPDVLKRPVKFGPNGLGLDVIMIGLDSMSRGHWIRKLPKTYKYLKEVLKVKVMDGYNIRTDGTTNNLLPILTGKQMSELPESRRGYANATYVDGYPWIWKEFKKQGYVTHYFEDNLGTFTFDLRLLGFKDQPTDHFSKHLLYEVEKYKRHPFGQFKDCLGEYPRRTLYYNYMKDFLMAYKNKPKFSFFFCGEFSHDDPHIVSIGDDDILNFLKWMFENKVLDNALLMVFADHGSRFDEFRNTISGRYEERNPFMSFRLPDKITKKYPDILKNLEQNTQRLTSNFDIHETLMEVLNYQNDKTVNPKSRGISLFKEVSLNRTCDDAAIPLHWCSCLAWEPFDRTNAISIGLGHYLITVINKLTSPHRSQCAYLNLARVMNVSKIGANDKMMKFKRSDMGEGFNVHFDKNPLKIPKITYQITIEVSPSGGMYEATVSHDLKTGEFILVNPEVRISRTNKYGSTADCIAQKYPNLRKFCYCQ